jgi:hypothetical protein
MIPRRTVFVDRSMLMASSSQDRPPSDPPSGNDAEDYEDESTAVRPRIQTSPPRRVRFQSGVWQSADSTDKGDRLEHKLRMAKALLESLPPNHARARLLRIAIIRRDEVVLDGLLEDLGAGSR